MSEHLGLAAEAGRHSNSPWCNHLIAATYAEVDNMCELTQRRLKECLKYDSSTGRFTWLKRPEHHFRNSHNCNVWNTKYAGKTAGNVKPAEWKTSYMRISVFDKSYKVHRLAWFYVHGYWPNEIDHVDGDGLNNKIDNLRDVDAGKNRRNMPLQVNNTSGVPGISWNKLRSTWHVYIKKNGLRKNLGYTRDFFEACCVRKSAELDYGFHSNHGRW